jgi:hypothetical protein
MTSIPLPTPDGSLEPYELTEPRTWPTRSSPHTSRVAYAAAHVVADPLSPAALDWDATLAARRHLWSCGLRVADAMDTAQRNAGLTWEDARELIARAAQEAKAYGEPAELLACGAGTDQGADTLEAVVRAYDEQVSAIQDAGARVILMASRQLAAIARGPEDYHEVYGRLLRQADRPVILHWLGEMFDPALAGYWGERDVEAATEALVAIVEAHAEKVDGVKVSLLNADHERHLRSLLPASVRVYTGDDFNYPELVEGGSDALLGVFAAIAPAASTALQALDSGDVAGFRSVLDPTVPLARHLFGAPTYYYKTGIAFLAWLSGFQPGLGMVAGLHSGRSVVHLAEAYRLADEIGILPDPELAARRMHGFLDVMGAGR